MLLSVVISVLNSHEIFRRQCLWWKSLNLPSDVEFIIIDDGSDHPLEDIVGVPNLRILRRDPLLINASRVWTVELARNLGARESRGKFLLMTDIDYIIPRESIEAAATLTEDKARFKREFGILDVNGCLSQDFNDLRDYGLLESRIRERGTRLPPHPNNFIIRKSTFFDVGCYREDLVARPYPNRGDTYFKRVWAKALTEGKVTEQHADLRTTLYMFPNGQYCGDVDYNPFGLFHTLTRKTKENYWYTHPRPTQ